MPTAHIASRVAKIKKFPPMNPDICTAKRIPLNHPSSLPQHVLRLKPHVAILAVVLGAEFGLIAAMCNWFCNPGDIERFDLQSS